MDLEWRKPPFAFDKGALVVVTYAQERQAIPQKFLTYAIKINFVTN